jgi:hypothetical protein
MPIRRQGQTAHRFTQTWKLNLDTPRTARGERDDGTRRQLLSVTRMPPRRQPYVTRRIEAAPWAFSASVGISVSLAANPFRVRD